MAAIAQVGDKKYKISLKLQQEKMKNKYNCNELYVYMCNNLFYYFVESNKNLCFNCGFAFNGNASREKIHTSSIHSYIGHRYCK